MRGACARARRIEAVKTPVCFVQRFCRGEGRIDIREIFLDLREVKRTAVILRHNWISIVIAFSLEDVSPSKLPTAQTGIDPLRSEMRTWPSRTVLSLPIPLQEPATVRSIRTPMSSQGPGRWRSRLP